MKRLIFALLLACSPQQDVIEAPTAPSNNPKFQLAADCPAACNKLREHNCPAGFQPDGGDSCEDICAQAINSGYLYWPSTCVANAQTLDEIRACGVTCP